MLRDDFGVGDVVFRQKSNYSAPAETSIIKDAEHWDVAITESVIEAVARRAVCMTQWPPSWSVPRPWV